MKSKQTDRKNTPQSNGTSTAQTEATQPSWLYGRSQNPSRNDPGDTPYSRKPSQRTCRLLNHPLWLLCRLAFVIHSSVGFRLEDKPASPVRNVHLEQGYAPATVKSHLLSPCQQLHSGYELSILHILSLNGCLILCDFNAQHHLWYTVPDKESWWDSLTDHLGTSHSGVLNEPEPTRVTATCSSSPELSLASFLLYTVANWCTDATLGSDHRVILVTLQRKSTKFLLPPKGTFINFQKAT